MGPSGTLQGLLWHTEPSAGKVGMPALSAGLSQGSRSGLASLGLLGTFLILTLSCLSYKEHTSVSGGAQGNRDSDGMRHGAGQ